MFNRKLIILGILIGSTLSNLSWAMNVDDELEGTFIPTPSITHLEDHLDRTILEDAINKISKEESDFLFIATNFSENEKFFLKQLAVSLPDSSPFGQSLSYTGGILFSNEEKTSQESGYGTLKNGLSHFFDEYTNASTLGEKYGICGNEFLANTVLEYCEKFSTSYSIQTGQDERKIYYQIRVSSFKENDVFLNYLNWHFDSCFAKKVILNFVGVFAGSPTVFATMNDVERAECIQTSNDPDSFRDYSEEELTNNLIEHRNTYGSNTNEYANIQREIDKIKILDENSKNDIIRILGRRMNMCNFIERSNITCSQPEPYQVALFAMNGEKKVLHSEPHMPVPRIFFSIRLYPKEQEVSQGSIFKSTSDPRTF